MGSAHRDVAGLLRKHQYRELKKIGEGSFGKAILVEDADQAKLVCKMVDVSQASTRETQDAVKEGKLLAQFKHPYIVRYRESFLESGWLCIFMDFCEGGDLTKRVEEARKRRQPFAEDQILRWFTQCMLALKYLHERHILHRDLKPGNFFLSKSGNMKMGDFGIAKVLSCTMACARTQIGTPYYLSPEVCQEKPYTWPSDIWAMGCILYELCQLKVPFDAPNISGLVQKICRGATPQITNSYSDFTKGLSAEMLNRNAQARPTSEDIIQRRPQIQGIVQQLFDEAQASAQDSVVEVSGDREPAARPGVASAPAPPDAGGAVPYCKGDLVEYHSSTHKDWLPATVLSADGEGRIIIDLKPNTWVSRDEQAVKVRPRRRPAPEVPAARGGTPLRQRSPSVGRAMTPSRARDFSPSRAGGSRAGSRAGTPGGGSRGGTPNRSRANTPNHMPSPRGFHAGSPQMRPPGMPMAKPSGPSRPIAGAGRAIAGM